MEKQRNKSEKQQQKKLNHWRLKGKKLKQKRKEKLKRFRERNVTNKR